MSVISLKDFMKHPLNTSWFRTEFEKAMKLFHWTREELDETLTWIDEAETKISALPIEPSEKTDQVDYEGLYGDQELFKEHSNFVMSAISNMVANEATLEVLIFYAGLRRYILAKESYTSNERLFGQLRVDDPRNVWENALSTPMVYERARAGARLLNAVTSLGNEGDNVTFEGTVYNIDDKTRKVVNVIIDGKEVSTLASNVDNLSNCTNKSYVSQKRWEFLVFNCGAYSEGSSPDDQYYQLMNETFEQIGYADVETIARLHWYLCIKVPHKRGGGAVAEWICAGIMLSKDIPFMGWSVKDVWGYAVTSGIDGFALRYRNLLKVL